MRALVAIILLILVAAIIAVGFGFIGGSNERIRAATPTIDNGVADMRDQGPGFEVEAGTRSPGAPEPPVGTATERMADTEAAADEPETGSAERDAAPAGTFPAAS